MAISGTGQFLRDGKGLLTLENELLTILPSQARLDEDLVYDASVSIDSLFDRDRRLDIQASMDTSVPAVMQFLFDGPLLKPEQRGRPMPIIVQSGNVTAKASISIPLRNLRATRVQGTAEVTAGEFLLPQGVPVKAASATINFTERSAVSSNIKANFLNGSANAKLITTEAAQPPKLRVTATGIGDIQHLQPWLGEHILSMLDGFTDWQGDVAIDGPKVEITAVSDLRGVAVTAPQPLNKVADQAKLFSLSMQTGGREVQNSLAFEYGSDLQGRFEGDMNGANKLFDRSLIRLGNIVDLTQQTLPPGVNFLVENNHLDIDAWLSAIIDLTRLETAEVESPDNAFLDAMRSVKISSVDPVFMSRQFGALVLSAVSVDGNYWIGTLNGDNISGTLQAEPRAEVGNYRFNLSRLFIVEAPKNDLPPDPIESTLDPAKYPQFELIANSFRLSDKSLGRLEISGMPDDDAWKLTKFEMSDQGIRTTGTGQWVNGDAVGSRSAFEIETTIDEAGGVLDEMDFDGILKKGNGTLKASIYWPGAPHEFDFARLNGEFELEIGDGELVKVEPGTGKLLGLLNFNAIARRLILDFRDVFSTGLQFDSMQYAGVLADGEAIMRDAFVLTPSVFIKMEGKLDLDRGAY